MTDATVTIRLRDLINLIEIANVFVDTYPGNMADDWELSLLAAIEAAAAATAGNIAADVAGLSRLGPSKPLGEMTIDDWTGDPAELMKRVESGE